AAIAAMLEVALRHDPDQAPRTTQWFTVPAIALVILPLLWRRRFPFAAPMFVWLVGATLSFIDVRLISFAAAGVVAGMVAAYLLGILRYPIQSRLGLAVVVSGAAIIVYNDPNRAAADFIFTPGLFAIGWLAGFALRERAVQAEAAEERALHAERERETA